MRASTPEYILSEIANAKIEAKERRESKMNSETADSAGSCGNRGGAGAWGPQYFLLPFMTRALGMTAFHRMDDAMLGTVDVCVPESQNVGFCFR